MKNHKLGLTGVIGCGKSTVSNCFASLGAATISADLLAKEAIQPHTSGYHDVVNTFGPSVVLPTGEINRQALAALIFSSPENRLKLESIIHPRVRERELELLEFYSNRALVVLEIPLLFESGAGVLCDSVAVVTCDETIRHNRLIQFRNMSLQEIQNREKAQWSQEKKAQFAHHIIDNSGDKQHTQAQVRALFEQLTQ
ncbi:MAG: dephospho-CoA kinase [Sumerlaeia bacterium]